MEFILGIFVGIIPVIILLIFCTNPDTTYTHTPYRDRLRFMDLQEQIDIIQESMDELNHVLNKHINEEGDGK